MSMRASVLEYQSGGMGPPLRPLRLTLKYSAARKSAGPVKSPSVPVSRLLAAGQGRRGGRGGNERGHGEAQRGGHRSRRRACSRDGCRGAGWKRREPARPAPAARHAPSCSVLSSPKALTVRHSAGTPPVRALKERSCGTAQRRSAAAGNRQGRQASCTRSARKEGSASSSLLWSPPDWTRAHQRLQVLQGGQGRRQGPLQPARRPAAPGRDRGCV